MNCSGIGSSKSSPSVDPGLGNETFISLRMREKSVRRIGTLCFVSLVMTHASPVYLEFAVTKSVLILVELR